MIHGESFRGTPDCYTQDNPVMCQDCKWVLLFGKQAYCGYVPPRCTLHQVIKGVARGQKPGRRCFNCEYYHNKLSSTKCEKCLSTENLDNFKLDSWVDEDEKWAWIKNEI